MRDAGLIRAIGVSNWQVSNLARMKAMGHELPAVNQIEVRKRKRERERETRSGYRGPLPVALPCV
jgi:diketogulonate reductase-like aldo/keto reductase